jgi:predicted ester cyclase
VIKRIEAQGALSMQGRNKILAAASRSTREKQNLAPGYRHSRYGFEHLRNYCKARGGKFELDAAIPDRCDRIEVLMAESDEVWMRFNTAGTHSGSLCGIAPTGKRVGVNVAAIMRFADGKVAESWVFADEFALLLQLGVPNLLVQS